MKPEMESVDDLIRRGCRGDVPAFWRAFKYACPNGEPCQLRLVDGEYFIVAGESDRGTLIADMHEYYGTP